MTALIPYFKPADIDVFGIYTLRAHGMLLVAGIAVGCAIALRKARRDGLSPIVLRDFLPWLFAALLLGSHVGELLFYQPRELLADPSRLLDIGRDKSSLGALLAGAAVGLWYFRGRERALAYADALVYGGTLGWSIGRVGCFLVHDHPGDHTRFWLGVHGICPARNLELACHDLGLYEAILALFLFLALVLLTPRPRVAGFCVMVAALGYGVSRLLLDFLRNPFIDARYFGLTPAQYGCVALISLGLWLHSKTWLDRQVTR